MKKIMRLSAMITMSLMLAACGSSSSLSSADYALTNGYSMGEGAADKAADAETVSESSDAAQITGEKLVYTGTLDIETLNYENTVNAVRQKIRDYKGIVESENESDGNYRWYEDNSTSSRYLSMTIRIPTDHFQDFLNDMEGSGKIVSRSQNVENISKKYNDNSVEIEALEKQEKRLLEMMDEARTIEDMISVETRLSDVQTQLNQKKSDQASMDTDIEYSTITLSISEVQKYTSENGTFDISNFSENVKHAFQTAGIFFIYVLQHILYGIIYLLPFIAITAVIILAIRKKKNSKKRDNHSSSEPKI